MRTPVDHPVGLGPVAEDGAAAVRAVGCQRVDRAFEVIEDARSDPSEGWTRNALS
jgi:hypothetical protein